MDLNLTLNINKQDIREIESSYDDLAGFLTNKYTSFSAAVFVLNTIIKATREAKKAMELI